MRKLLIGFVLTLSLLMGAMPSEASPIVAGDTVTLADSFGTIGGGEFILTVNNAFSFITFCLQRTQYIDFSHTFKVDGVTTYAYSDPVANGGIASGPEQGRDYISPQTAFLYTMFRNQTLTGYSFSGTSAQRTASANLLQNAFWMFENELPMDNSNTFVQLANSAVNGGAWSGTGEVKVLNLSYNGIGAQDQLALVPGPSSLVLLGSGIVIFAVTRRRRLARSIA